MIKYYIFYFWVLLNVIFWTIIFGSLGVLGSLFERQGKFVGWIVRTWSKNILFFSGIKFISIGFEKIDTSSNYFFAANHESALDIPLVFASVPLHMVSIAKVELKKIPFLGWAMQAGGHFFVDRKNHKRSMSLMNFAKKSMKDNPRSVIIFPEGTRSKDGRIMPFKKGGLLMAINLNVPVVPVGIIGARSYLKDRFINKKSNSLKIKFGKPLLTNDLSYEDRDDFALKVRNEVLGLVKN